MKWFVWVFNVQKVVLFYFPFLFFFTQINHHVTQTGSDVRGYVCSCRSNKPLGSWYLRLLPSRERIKVFIQEASRTETACRCICGSYTFRPVHQIVHHTEQFGKYFWAADFTILGVYQNPIVLIFCDSTNRHSHSVVTVSILRYLVKNILIWCSILASMKSY